ALYAVFLGISLLCWCGYLLAGMNMLDAFVHMCATVGLGGFSTRDAGIAAFDSFGVEFVAMLFMLVSGINFATHFSAWRTRGLGSYRRCPETRYFLALALGSGLVVSAFLYFQHVYGNPWDALRYGMFNTISVATTTGFANTDYALW